MDALLFEVSCYFEFILFPSRFDLKAGRKISNDQFQTYPRTNEIGGVLRVNSKSSDPARSSEDRVIRCHEPN